MLPPSPLDAESGSAQRGLIAALEGVEVPGARLRPLQRHASIGAVPAPRYVPPLYHKPERGAELCVWLEEFPEQLPRTS